MYILGFPGGASGKEPTCQWRRRDADLVPGSGRSPGGGHGNPLRYSSLENPMDRGAYQATVHRVAKSRTQLKWRSMHACILFPNWILISLKLGSFIMLLLYMEEHWAQYAVFALLSDYFWGAHIFKTLFFTHRTSSISEATCDDLIFSEDAYFFFALAEYLNSCYFAILFVLGIFIWSYIAKLCVSITKELMSTYSKYIMIGNMHTKTICHLKIQGEYTRD